VGAGIPPVQNAFRVITGEVYPKVLDFVDIHLYFSCNDWGSIDADTN